MHIDHVPAHHRFIARLPEGDGVLAYRVTATGSWDIVSTYVPVGARGRGIGGALVRAAQVEETIEFRAADTQPGRPGAFRMSWSGGVQLDEAHTLDLQPGGGLADPATSHHRFEKLGTRLLFLWLRRNARDRKQRGERSEGKQLTVHGDDPPT